MSSQFELSDWLKRLEGIPQRIAKAIDGWTETDLRRQPAPGEWSAAEVLAHLRASEDITAPRIYMMLVRDNPPLTAYDERKWAEITNYAQGDFHTSLRLYALRRAELVTTLRRITPEDWAHGNT
jgi:hypothetical protein